MKLQDKLVAISEVFKEVFLVEILFLKYHATPKVK